MTAGAALRAWYGGTDGRLRLLVELAVHGRCTGLADQEMLTRVLGLDMPPETPRAAPGTAVRPNKYRRGTRGKSR